MKRRILSVLLALSLTMALVFPAWASVELPDGSGGMDGETVIIHTNDSHGRSVADDANKIMGFSSVSALKKAYEAAGANVLLLDAGDTLHGLPFATITKGESVVTLMNMAGYDAMTPGNHDFNYGSDYLAALSETMDFSLLSANISLKSSGNQNFLKPSSVIEKNSVRYGIFGLSTPETEYKTNPANVSQIQFTSPVEAARQQVDLLRQQDVDYIIALAHVGLSGDSEYTTEMIAKQVEGIDVIIDGHSHTVLEDGMMVGNTLIASTGEYLKNIGVVQIHKDGTKQAGLVTSEQFNRRDFAIDAEAEKVTEEQKQVLSEQVGTTAVLLDGEREHVRKQETNLGNLGADAVRDETGADVAMINGGGIRATIPAGKITKNDLVSVFPFGNYVVTKRITGKTLVEFLEHGVSAYPELSGGFPQISGATFTFDSSQPAGSRVLEVKVGGKPVEESKTYLLATNDYIAAGGDQYTMIGEAPLVNEFSSLEECLARYIRKLGDVEIQTENRILVKNQATEKEQPAADSQPPKQEPAVTDGTVTYAVKRGDTLWQIAKSQLGDGDKWHEIYERNRDKIANPNQIRAGQELRIR